MALFFECMPMCARKRLDTADIVREGMFQQLAQRCRHVARRSYSRKLLRGTRFESSSALGRAVQRSVPYSKEFRALSFYVGMSSVISQDPVNGFYKKGCQEKSFPSTGGREDFVSRSSPLHCKSASRFAREVLLLSCLPFL